MDHVSEALRIFASCVAAAFAAFVVWYAAYAVMWLLMWLVAALCAIGAAWLAGNYVHARLGCVQLGTEGVATALRSFYAAAKTKVLGDQGAAHAEAHYAKAV